MKNITVFAAVVTTIIFIAGCNAGNSNSTPISGNFSYESSSIVNVSAICNNYQYPNYLYNALTKTTVSVSNVNHPVVIAIALDPTLYLATAYNGNCGNATKSNNPICTIDIGFMIDTPESGIVAIQLVSNGIFSDSIGFITIPKCPA